MRYILIFLICFSANSQSYKGLNSIDTLSVKLSEIDASYFKKLKIREDKFLNTTIITPKFKGSVYPYLIISGKAIILRCYVSYTGSNWVFMDKLYFSIDNELLIYDLPKSKRKVTSKGVIESSDFIVDQKMDIIINLIKLSEKPIIGRFYGDRNSDFYISKKNIEGYNSLINLYNELTKD